MKSATVVASTAETCTPTRGSVFVFAIDAFRRGLVSKTFKPPGFAPRRLLLFMPRLPAAARLRGPTVPGAIVILTAHAM